MNTLASALATCYRTRGEILAVCEAVSIGYVAGPDAEVFARLVREPNDAEILAKKSGLDPANLLIFNQQPDVFWSKIMEEAANQRHVADVIANLRHRFSEADFTGDPVRRWELIVIEARKSGGRDKLAALVAHARREHPDQGDRLQAAFEQVARAHQLPRINNPYQLQCGHQLSLTELPALMQEALKINMHFLVVFGTGRYPESYGTVGLVSDCLYLPEIIASVHKIARQAQVENVRWCSALDIDLITDLENGSADRLGQAHLLLPGTGDVNAITGLVMTCYQEQGQPLRPGCSPPFLPEIVGIKRHYTPRMGKGFLTLCVNPWNSDALCIVAGGVHSSGTSAALYLLSKYLESSAVNCGNNNYDPNVPSKIFDAPQIQYSSHIRDRLELTPKEDIRNIDCHLQKWEFFE